MNTTLRRPILRQSPAPARVRIRMTVALGEGRAGAAQALAKNGLMSKIIATRLAGLAPLRGRTVPTAIALVHGRAQRLHGVTGPIRCTAGKVWLTQTGEGGDHLLAPGDSYDLAGRGRIVIEALTDRAEITLAIQP